MRQSPLFSSFIYILLGILFTYFAIDSVQKEGWGFFSYLLVMLATFDIGAGFRILAFYFKNKNMKKK